MLMGQREITAQSWKSVLISDFKSRFKFFLNYFDSINVLVVRFELAVFESYNLVVKGLEQFNVKGCKSCELIVSNQGFVKTNHQESNSKI